MFFLDSSRTDTLQDSAFLSLPLEIRHQIYSYLIRVGLKKEVTSNALKPLTNLTGVNQQIRCEVYGMIAAVTTFHIDAGIFSNFKLKPLDIASKIRSMSSRVVFDPGYVSLARSHYGQSSLRSMQEGLIQTLDDEIKSLEVPAQFKFWKVCVSIFNTDGERRLVANINFKEKEVRVCRPGAIDDDLRDQDPAGSLEQTFIDVMQKFSKMKGSDEVTIQEVSRFLEQVTMPNPNGIWAAEKMFEEFKGPELMSRMRTESILTE